MNKESNKYNSIPFQLFYLENNGHEINIDYTNRILKIKDKTGFTKAVIHFSKNINHEINIDELLNKRLDKKENAYYVYENGINGLNWLWHFGDLISLADIFNS